MEKIDFPLNGNLRERDIFRTVYKDGTVLVRVQEDLAGFHLLELAALDWKQGCTQDTWDLGGTGIFLSTANKDLPSLRIDEDSNGERIYRLFNLAQPEKLVKLESQRGSNLLKNILNNSTHDLMTLESFNETRNKLMEMQLQRMKELKQSSQNRPTQPLRPASQGPLKRQRVEPRRAAEDSTVYFADD